MFGTEWRDGEMLGVALSPQQPPRCWCFSGYTIYPSGGLEASCLSHSEPRHETRALFGQSIRSHVHGFKNHVTFEKTR